MVEEKQQEIKKFSFESEDLKTEVKGTDFIFEGRNLFKFEDKKPIQILVEKNEDILQSQTKFGLKYYIPITIKKEKYYWQCSATTLKSVLGAIENTTKLNIMLETEYKRYMIIPIIDL